MREMVAGRYRLTDLAGTGGMGRVWRAYDELLDRTVAVKEVLRPGLSPGDEAEAHRLTVREARSAARLDHPNVVRVFDVVWTPGRSWIVMEFVPGRSLHEVIAQDGPVAHAEAARIGRALLAALSAAHAAGVLHHDVKPRNVLLAPDGRVVLTDFGIATIGTDPTGTLVGTPAFLAPERAGRGVAGPATDLWSLGATLYATVEGRPPFDRPTPAGTLLAAQIDEPDPPHRPGPVHEVIAGLLTRDPVARWTAARARDGLEAVLRHPTGAPPRREVIRFVAGAAAVPVSPAPAARKRPGLLTGWPVIIGTAVAGIGMLVASAVLLLA
ncbi:serine/threonine-protein kinase [Paractinoplanes lichenicola]|uniref:serine/threonine-protein kinase n=1 Tax=Paractinoplanes lichenicola TaxID=2802976 RepID=UPI001F1F8368|nr:serine/threonine-protein kinase [Actinoplanes lichenicola]